MFGTVYCPDPRDKQPMKLLVEIDSTDWAIQHVWDPHGKEILTTLSSADLDYLTDYARSRFEPDEEDGFED